MLKRIIIMVLAVILLVAYGYLGMDYFSQSGKQKQLADEISGIEKEMAALPDYTGDFSGTLAAAEESLLAEYGVMSGSADSSAIIDAIFTLAGQNGVTATPLLTAPWMEESIGDSVYHAFRLSVEVQGDYPDVGKFISDLENSEFISMVVENVSITLIDEDAEGAPAGDKPVNAGLDLAVYTSAINFD